MPEAKGQLLKFPRPDHSDEVLWVYPSRDESDTWWCAPYGNVEIPEGWDSIAAGDAFLTRQVKLMGPHWIAVKRRKGYTERLGVFAPQENVEAAKKLAEETKAQREAKRVVSRVQREKQEATYRQQFEEAVYRYLGFAPEHERLARDIARATAERATVVGSERVGRTSKLSLEQKAELAARAHIRHNHTKFDDRLFRIEMGLGSPLEPDDYLYREAKAEAHEDVDRFLERHRRRRRPRSSRF